MGAGGPAGAARSRLGGRGVWVPQPPGLPASLWASYPPARVRLPSGHPFTPVAAQLLSLAFCCPASQSYPPRIPASQLSALPKRLSEPHFIWSWPCNVRSRLLGVDGRLLKPLNKGRLGGSMG